MFIRTIEPRTLGSISEELNSRNHRIDQVPNSELKIHYRSGEIQMGPLGSVPITDRGVKELGDWIDVPFKTIERFPEDLREHVINTLLGRINGIAAVAHDDGGVHMIRKPDIKLIPVSRLVEIAAKTIDPTAEVHAFWADGDEFRLDVIAPDNFDRGIGGDRKVGDITKGGLRIGQNVKTNQAPWISEYLYRLVCTNGMERFDENYKLSARGNTVEDVLADFEEMADRAFRRVEDTISAFYEMRKESVDNPVKIVSRIIHEEKIPARIGSVLIEQAAELDTPSNMFDITNLFTNLANDPALKDGPVRRLQGVGGNMVAFHAERCATCLHRLN